MLAEKIAHYEATGKMLRCWPSQYKAHYPWLQEVDSSALIGAYNALEAAYNNFFRNRKAGYPKFKSKRKGHNSFTTKKTNGNIELTDTVLKLPNLGMIKVKKHRQIPEGFQMKSVTISLTSSGKYFASILYEYDKRISLIEPEKVIGLDFSMTELFVPSEGIVPDYPRPYRNTLVKLAKEQRKLSRRDRGGSNYNKQKRKVARIHEHVTNQRKDFLHKQSRQITNVYDAVCIEDLNMKGMSQTRGFGKSVSDNGWGIFTRMLEYKLFEQGKQLVKIGKWYPSSKKCSKCGKTKELLLSDRIYSCDCGLVLDRDHNAAINIRNEGIRLLA